MSNENVVLVTGGTGSQGGATVTHLLAAKKVRVRVLTRNLESPKAKSLAAHGVELVKADFEDVASLRTALAGVSAAFSVQQWTEKGGTAAEELDGKRFADAVKASGSPHLVYSSAEGAERKSGLAHYESKWAIEQHIRDLKLPATILRPVGFMDALGVPAIQRGMYLGMFRANWGVSHRVQFMATYDIGWFAARARRPRALRRTRHPARRGRVERRRYNQDLQDRHRAQALGGADPRLCGQEDDAGGVRGHVPLDSRKGLRSGHCPGAARTSAAANICRLAKEIH